MFDDAFLRKHIIQQKHNLTSTTALQAGRQADYCRRNTCTEIKLRRRVIVNPGRENAKLYTDKYQQENQQKAC